jgi:hypothetical protein
MSFISIILIPFVFTLIELLPIPPGWQRTPVEPGSFGAYVQGLPFEPTDSTYFWDGRVEIYHGVAAVHHLENLTENQQCADIIMRLYSEYRKDNNLPLTWHSVNGSIKTWNGNNFNRYMNDIYAYSNTYSLSEYDSYAVPLSDMKPGDILIIPGFPGHTVIVADVIRKNDRLKIAVIEGYTPAVQPFLFSADHEVFIEWIDGVTISGYNFTENNLRRIN